MFIQLELKITTKLPLENFRIVNSTEKIHQVPRHIISLRHSVNGDFCGHSRFVLWHQNLTTFVSWTLAKSESWGGGGRLALIS